MKQVKHLLTNSATQTRKLGEILAKEVLKTALSKKALLFALQGELGSGKTTFLQGFAKGLGIKGKILSPTFIIMRKSEIQNPKPRISSKSKIQKFKTFYHIDCYRIKKPKEIFDLGFKRIIVNPQNIVAVEWAERLKKNLPRNALKIKFSFIDKNTRKMVL